MLINKNLIICIRCWLRLFVYSCCKYTEHRLRVCKRRVSVLYHITTRWRALIHTHWATCKAFAVKPPSSFSTGANQAQKATPPYPCCAIVRSYSLFTLSGNNSSHTRNIKSSNRSNTAYWCPSLCLRVAFPLSRLWVPQQASLAVAVKLRLAGLCQ